MRHTQRRTAKVCVACCGALLRAAPLCGGGAPGVWEGSDVLASHLGAKAMQCNELHHEMERPRALCHWKNSFNKICRLHY